MSAIHRNELRGATKARLFDDVLHALRGLEELVWCRPIRDESMIVGQLRDGRPVGVVVKLPAQIVPDATQAFLTAMNSHNGCGFVVRQVSELGVWIRGIKNVAA